jgi:hypothetical protein
MWSAHTEQLSEGDVLRIRILQQSSPVTLDEVIRGWSENRQFRSFFIELLARVPFVDYRWETPASTKSSAAQNFEFVVVNSPGLADTAEPSAFAEHFARSTTSNGVVSFYNLGKDACLIVPCPIASPEVYRHLGTFVRQAPEEQKHKLWKMVGTEMTRNLGKVPIWLSTAGAGVSWLHVRIDQRPKYYVHAPYRKL